MTATAMQGTGVGRGRDLGRWLMHRSDAWGVTWVIAAAFLVMHDAVTPWTIALTVAVSAMYWLGYAVNDYFDAPDDALEPHKARTNYFVRHPMARRRFMAMLLATVGSVMVVFAHWGLRGIAVFGAYFVVMWTYSSPPFRFKNVPGVDLLMHAAFALTYPYWIGLALLDVEWTDLDTVVLVGLFLFSLSSQLEQQLRDHASDALTGGTFTTHVGPAWATALLRVTAGAVVVTGVVAALVTDVPVGLVPYAFLVVPALAFRLGIWRVHARPAGVIWLLVAAGLVYSVALLVWFGQTGNHFS